MKKRPQASKRPGKVPPVRGEEARLSPSPKKISDSDRRRSARLGLNAVTRYIAAGEEYVGVTRLINLGGMLLEVGEPLALGMHIHVELNLPNSLEPFRAKGEVVYRNSIRGRLAHVAGEMGIKFVELDEVCVRMLQDLTARYQEFNSKHSVFSKEMSTFHDPSIIPATPDAGDEGP